MSTITKQAVQAVADLKAGYTLGHADVAILNELARIALASLEAEAVCVIDQSNLDYLKSGSDADVWPASRTEMGDVLLYRAAPPAPVSVPDDIDTRLKNAGMLSAAEIIAGQPIDAFMKHAGVVDLESLLKWSEMRRAEFLRMQAKYELGDNPKDDMYEWVISHVAAFSELHVNIRAAMLQGAEPVTTANKLPAIGWLRADYQDDNRGLRGNAPLFVLGKKDPSTAWGLDYIPLTSNYPVIPDGWALVPIEPTYQMCEAMGLQWESPRFPDRYKAMLAAVKK